MKAKNNNIKNALFMIVQLATNKTLEKKILKNEKDIKSFIDTLTKKKENNISENYSIGPFVFDKDNIKIYISYLKIKV